MKPEIEPTPEVVRIAEQIHEQWPFISVKDAVAFAVSLGYVSLSEGTARICLWVLARVLEHKTTK